MLFLSAVRCHFFLFHALSIVSDPRNCRVHAAACHVPPSPNRRRPLQYSSFSPAVVLALLRLPFLRLPFLLLRLLLLSFFLLLLLLLLLLPLLLRLPTATALAVAAAAANATAPLRLLLAPAACCCRCHRSWCCCCSGEQAETYKLIFSVLETFVSRPRNVSFETLVSLWFR